MFRRKEIAAVAVQPLADCNPIPETGIDAATRGAAMSSNHIDKISLALAKAQGDVELATRTQSANDDDPREAYDYADLADIMIAIRDAAANNGLAVFERFPAGKNSLQSILVHESGQWLDYGYYDLGKAATHQERQSAITYGRKSMRRCIFGIADTDDDAQDAGGVETIVPGLDLAAGGINRAMPDGSPGHVKRTGFAPKDPLRPHKENYQIVCPVTIDGDLNYDEFAAELEQHIEQETDGYKLSMWNRSNAQTLDRMEKERPDLFNNISEKFRLKGQELM